MKLPDKDARDRINQALLAVFIELEVDPSDVMSTTITPHGISFTLEVPMRVEIHP
jgi:hypothetical protein